MARLLQQKMYSKIDFMKTNTTTLRSSLILFITAAILLSACSTTKNTPESMQALTRAIDSSKWKFTATQVKPQYGQSGPANGTYDVSLNTDQLTVYLPYFGRAFSGVNGYSGKGPLDFSSTNFSINKEKNKKGAWLITIKPADNNEVQSMTFTFYNNGSANLNVTLNNRTPISFSGTVEKK